MKAKQSKPPPDEMRMSSEDFARIMGRALQVKPEAQKPKRAAKAARKKRSASK